MTPLARFYAVVLQSRVEIAVWLAAMAVYVSAVLIMTLSLKGGPLSPAAAAENAAFRADYLAPWRLFQAGLLAPLIETWLIVKGVDALHAFRWRGPRLFMVVALVAATLHYFARGVASALYNAAFFVLMARIYTQGAYENEQRGENRPAAIGLILLLHILNNALALGMIGVYAAGK